MRLPAPRRHPGTAPSDEGGIVIGWLTKIVVVLSLAGLGLFDAISIGTTAVTLTDQGSYAAREASMVWRETRDVQRAYNAAVVSAQEQNGSNQVDAASFRIGDDDTVHLRVSREAPTLVLYHWGRTAEWAQLERPATGRALP